MEPEIDDKEFDDLLAEKRHKEIAKSLKDIARILSIPAKSDEEILNAVKENVKVLNEVVLAIDKQESQVNVTVENNEILPLLKEIREGNNRVLEVLLKKPIVDRFKIESTDQWTKTIQVVYK